MTGENDKPHIVRTSPGFLANTAAIVTETLTLPLTSSVIITDPNLPPFRPTRSINTNDQPIVRPGPADRPPQPAPSEPSIPVPKTFKLIFLTVVAITFVGFIAEIAMAAYWTSPTADQHNVVLAADFAWKAGVGAIVGLLSGKQI